MDKPLRVLRLSPAIYREGNWPVAFDPVGGLQMQVWRITGQLSKMGVEQTVLTSHIPGSPRRVEPFPATIVRSVGPWLPQAMGRWFLNLGWFLGLLPELLFRAGHYDLAHVHFNHSIWCRVAALLATARGLPTIVSTNTELWGDLKGALSKLPALIERLALSTASRVLAPTAADAERKSRQMSLDRTHFAVVPDAIDIDRFAAPEAPGPAIERFRAAYKIAAGAKIVTYVGRISAEKGWQDLPSLLAQPAGEPVFLLVCGDGPHREKLASALRRLEQPASWCITGFLSPDDIKIAMRAADALVLPSRREAFGGVLLEAMASGLPAIAYQVGGIGEVAGDPPAVRLVPGGATARLVEAVGDVTENHALRSMLIARGKSRVRDFSIDRVGDATLAVYRSVSRKPSWVGAGTLERHTP